MHKCPSCDYENVNLDSIRIHCSKRHKMGAKEVRLLMFHNNVSPLCKCGCNEETRFVNIHVGFNEYIRGHHSRVTNNWGHNKAALDKSHATNKARLESGENVIWNKGLTKDTHLSVAKYGNTGSKTILASYEERQKRSEKMKTQWNEENITPLYGTNHPNWHGGVSKVGALARSLTFNVWTYPKLKAASFTCTKCGSKENLCVHHDDIMFHVILREAVKKFGDVLDENDFEQKSKIAEWVAAYHVENNVSGVVLCEVCHGKEHVLSTEYA